MKRTVIFCTLAAALCCAPLQAANEDSGDKAAPPAKTSTTPKTQGADKAGSKATAAKSPDTFTPSEQINEDLSVSFPVDI